MPSIRWAAVELGFVAKIPSIVAHTAPEHGATAAALAQLANELEIDRLTTPL